MAFVLLGFALESSSGCSYEEVLSSTIYEPLGLSMTSLTKPNHSQGAIPDGENDWHTDFGKYEATGGIYSTSSDMSVLARAILTHKLLDEATTNAWFAPRSYSSSLEFAYGMPWEIFRTTSLLQDSQRSQTIVSKAGNVRGYASRFVLFPEYGVGLTVLVAGDGRALTWIEEEILKTALPKVEEIARQQVCEKYTGTYAASPGTVINSSVDLEVQGSSGLVVTSWISNGTNFQDTFATLWKMESGTKGPCRVQLTPSRIWRGLSDEVWHAQVVTESLPNTVLNTNLVEDIDPFLYASRAIEEFVFQHNEEGDVIGVELPALRITLRKKTTKKAHPGPRTRGQKLLEVQHSAKH
ncbi:MAG: hypothetical protein Q9214_000251 [Letrouitia sp. 1 TL-2023]